MALTRRKRRLSEKIVRSKLTEKNYDKYLDENFYFGENPFKLPADDDWDPATGSCAMHALFTIESLGGNLTKDIKNYKGFKLLNETTVDSIIKILDLGSIVELTHVYRDKNLVKTLPRNNVYDSHDFCLIKGDSKYFLSQGYQFAYKHSLKALSREQLKQMLLDIIVHLCDYDNNKVWKDLDLSYYNKYFKADLTLGKMDKLPVNPEKKVNGIVLEYIEIKRK
jgi:hypothetical protein